MRLRLRDPAAGYTAAVAGMAAVTAAACVLRAHINEMTVALAMLLVVLSVAAVWEFLPALVASVVGMLCLNYFFLPPIYTFTIQDPRNWIALAAFFITALVAGQLSRWAKLRAAEAEASRSQARLASAYNRSLLEATLDPLITVGGDGRINDLNAAAETATGRSRLELIGSEFGELFTEPAKAKTVCERVFRDVTVRGYGLEIRHRGGHSTSVLFDGSLYHDAFGTVIGVVATLRPICTYGAKSPEMRPDPMVAGHLKLLVNFVALFSVAAGVVSIAGLVFGIRWLKSITPDGPVIKMNAAVCLVLLGLALWFKREKRTGWAGSFLAGAAALVGLLSFLEHIAGYRLGIDQLVYRELPGEAIVPGHPGLMSVIAAVNAMLLGAALLLLDRDLPRNSGRYWPAQALAAFTAIYSIFGLLGFLLGSPTSYTHISLQASVSLLLIALGVLCARIDRGVAALLASSTGGGALTRRLIPGSVVFPVLIGALALNALSSHMTSEWGSVSLMIVAMIVLLSAFSVWNGYIVNQGDIERERAEAILQRRQVELSEAERMADLGSWWRDAKADNVIWSAGLSHIAGRDPMLPPPSWTEHLHFRTPESAALLDGAVEEAIQTGAPFELELDMIRRDGAGRKVAERGEVERDADGQIVLVRGTVQDITERKRAEDEIRMLALRQSVVAELGRQALRSGDLVNVLNEAVLRATRVLGVDYARVLELQPDGKTLLLRAGVGWKEGVAGREMVSAGPETQAGFTLISKEPVILEDLRTEKRFQSVPMFGDSEVVSGMSVIISLGGGPYGVFSVHTQHPRKFTADELTFLQAVANILGTIIERRRAEDEILRINRAQRALSSCNETLIRATDEAKLPQDICRIIADQAGYRFCWVGHAEHDEAKTVKPLAWAGYEEGYLQSANVTWADSDRGRGPTGTCIRTRRTQMAKSYAEPAVAPWRDEALKRGYGSSVAVPIVVDSEVFGALTIYSRAAEAFGREEVSLLNELAADLGFGIGAIRNRNELRALNTELERRVISRTAELRGANQQLEQAREREIEIGFRIQQQLLLDQPPVDIPGLRVAAMTIPSQRIDGDFYIFIRHADDCLDVIVGDVMGKGIPAALLGAATKSHFLKALGDLMGQCRKGELPEPKEIVMLAHAELVQHLIDLDSFVTLVYARFDGKNRRLKLVDCGHTGTVLMHGRTGVCEVVHGDNLPMGVREGEIYDQISVVFEPGDLVLFFSDGITEARNPAGELFGDKRLEECVAANGKLEPGPLIEAIRTAVVTFSESNKLADDLTAVAVSVEERQRPVAQAELEITSDPGNLRRAREFVREFCVDRLDAASAGELDLAVNETLSNIMKHAYHGRSDQWIHMEAEAFSGHVAIRLHHLGDPFKPAAAPPPALDGSRESGFGAYIIAKCADEVRYYRDERGRSCIALVKVRK